ncbi:hypothetical protein KSF_000830 [Reticulibacter mediterranei]|uniref:Uncharacterized protein n=1 Tax=Reticulibacter mediterranei TaxID=2778369 RepID=A0A8J3ICS0_9CHLR|nr:hypothetical protein KSF_000830 [Reticulibacter mediterranei]
MEGFESGVIWIVTEACVILPIRPPSLWRRKPPFSNIKETHFFHCVLDTLSPTHPFPETENRSSMRGVGNELTVVRVSREG